MCDHRTLLIQEEAPESGIGPDPWEYINLNRNVLTQSEWAVLVELIRVRETPTIETEEGLAPVVTDLDLIYLKIIADNVFGQTLTPEQRQEAYDNQHARPLNNEDLIGAAGGLFSNITANSPAYYCSVAPENIQDELVTASIHGLRFCGY
ncbi:MAG UNVERIFIED_CONTAM: hypothetical protein LVQ98_09275 [Rickettsiaceae bacterium]